MIEARWIGRRISVRRGVGPGSDGRQKYSDVVGELVGLSAGHAVVDARSGRIEVALSDVAVARLVPPSTAEELALAVVVAAGWRAEQNQSMGDWVLRASGGFTRRANSVLVAGQPGVPLDEALGRAADWYAERGLPLVLQLPTEARRLLDAELGERGWDFSGHTGVLVRALDDSVAPRGLTPTRSPSRGWLELYRAGAHAHDRHALAVLADHPQLAFFEIANDDGLVIACLRATVDGPWLGITCIQTAPEHRRAKLASTLVAEAMHWGAAYGARQVHAEVEEPNVISRAMFESLGFWHHHDYRFRHAPH